VPLYIQELRGTVAGSSALTGALAAAVGVLTGVCGLAFAPLGDRHDRMGLLSLFVAAGALCALPIFFLAGPWSFVVLYVLSAMCLGPANPFLESTMAVLTTRGTRGVLFGVEAFMGSMAMFAAPVVGSLVAIGLTLKHVFLAFGLALTLAAAAARLAGRSARRNAAAQASRISPASGAPA
jgi:DHA1 family multidrug resistance protein-like MFS transporter